MRARKGGMGARILAVANRKGGTGKSTVAVNLAAELGARGYRVLVVDLDPQGHAGLGYGIFADDAARASHAVFGAAPTDLLPAIHATAEPGVDVIAADRDFDGQTGRVDPRCLARALQPLRPCYDVMLLDSPPVAASIIVCALLAADGVVVPTTLDYLSLDGVQQFVRSYHHVVRSLRTTLLGLAIAPMRVDLRATMQRAVLERLAQGFGRNQLLRGIFTDVGVAEAFHHRVPLRRYRARSRAVDDFRIMADDISRRFNLH
jgi:chromosome partitioning protein